MVALMEVYREEDEAYQEFVTLATMFFQYLLKPFRDMREFATSCKLDILKSLDEDDLGPRRIAALRKEAQGWTRRAEAAVVSIQDITVNYFKETVKALAGMQKQMEQDEKRFGPAAWASAAPRLERLKLMLARETLQLLRAKELCLNHRRAEIQGKMEDLPEEEKNIDVVDELEIQFYEVQLELYDVKFEILKYEEILLTTQLDSIKRLIKDKQDEVVYYDPCESPEELKAADRVPGLPDGAHAETRELRRRRERLEQKRGRICARRAHLRSRKDQCKENHRLRLQQAEESVRCFHQHHSIQMKRDKLKEEEQKKKEWINQERQKTLQRLRAFKQRCPSRPPCSEPEAPSLPAASHRNLNEHAGTSGEDDQPLPLVCEPPAERPHDPADGFTCPGSMDEVLASLRHGRAPVQKAGAPAAAPPCASVNERILAAIRQGVRLRKVHPEVKVGLSPGSAPTSDLERSIKAALQRIKRVSADSEEEEEEEEEGGPGEWDH
ncbi:WASP-like protein associated with actin, golgi membranes and microtubules [Phyllostomus discolor]|uniref:WASP-like protein associated with actin, golgi membranes and microtubules n=1 Tax=Phyllostomus discolor TaxID=89673 RepID=A0A834DHB7_9CHIR|nr:WASP-like protein associated with actin, golgi membranes and microtubules [Phyllostomus discolor]